MNATINTKTTISIGNVDVLRLRLLSKKFEDDFLLELFSSVLEYRGL
ncbi:hypothetical protein [Pontimicrobium sp. MEBiC01747]